MSLAALHTAIEEAWFASDVDRHFRSYWPIASQSSGRYITLMESEALPGQQFPYAVFSFGAGAVQARASAARSRLYKTQQREVPFTVTVYAETDQTAGKNAKQICIECVAEVLKLYGGHPTQAPTAQLSLSSGCVLNTKLINEFGTQENDSVYRWDIEYMILVDEKVKVL